MIYSVCETCNCCLRANTYDGMNLRIEQHFSDPDIQLIPHKIRYCGANLPTDLYLGMITQ